MVLLHLMRWMRAKVDCDFELLLLSGGDLEAKYAELARVTTVVDSTLAGSSPSRRVLEKILSPRRLRRMRKKAGRRCAKRVLRNGNWDLVYVNTVAPARLFEGVNPLRCPIVCHVHEMRYALELSRALPLLERADRIIVPSDATRVDLEVFASSVDGKVRVIYECVEREGRAEGHSPGSRELRRALGIGPEDFVVGAVGTVDLRKGADLFLQLAIRLLRERNARPVRLLWIGEEPKERSAFADFLRHDLAKLGLAESLRFTGGVDDVTPYYDLMDVLALTSREDPCPLVCIEAALREVPIACFAGSGGAPEIFGDGAATIAPYLDATAMADQIRALLADPERRAAMGRRGAEIARKQHDVNEVAPQIWSLLEPLLSKAEPGGRRDPR
ncbi:MAG TPA: glycosyltransferase family 4 protein [Myxococcota bacterium]